MKSLNEFFDTFVVPSGPYAGDTVKRTKNIDQLIELIENFFFSPARELYILGPNQCGKSMVCVGVCTYYVLVLRQPVIIFGPTVQSAVAMVNQIKTAIEMMCDKKLKLKADLSLWVDGVPVYARGQSDAQRAQVTAPLIVVTEADKIRRRPGDESDPIDQIRARGYAYTRRKLICESTISHSRGLMWTAYNDDKNSIYEIRVICPHCKKTFWPDVSRVTDDGGYTCVCGKTINPRENCGLVSIRVGASDRWVVRMSAITAGWHDGISRDIIMLRASNDVNDKNRLCMQFLCQPPADVMVDAPPPEPATGIRRGDVRGCWAVGVDVKRSGIHTVIMVKDENDFIIADFSYHKDIKKFVEKIKNYPDRGCVFFDYGYDGQRILSQFMEAAVSVIPIRGMDDARFTVKQFDLRAGPYWRYRQMIYGDRSLCLQFMSRYAKSLFFNRLCAKQIKIFEYSDDDADVKNFFKSILESEIYVDGMYKKVLSGNHFFDAAVYAMVGAEFLFGSAEDPARVSPPQLVYKSNEDNNLQKKNQQIHIKVSDGVVL